MFYPVEGREVNSGTDTVVDVFCSHRVDQYLLWWQLDGRSAMDESLRILLVATVQGLLFLNGYFAIPSGKDLLRCVAIQTTVMV